MAPDARRAAHLAVVDTVAERDLRGRCPGGSRQGACRLGASVRMDAFRRPHLLNGSRSRSNSAGGGGGLDPHLRGSAPEDDPPDASVRVVRDVERAVGPDRESRRPVRGLTRFFHRSGEAVGEDHILPGGLAVSERLEHHVVAAWGNGARFHDPWKAMNAPPR